MRWYVFGVGFLVAGVVLGVVTAVSLFGMIDRIGAMPRFVGPGSFTVTLPEGESIIYLERRSLVGGKSYAITEVGFGCEEPEGTTLELKRIGTFDYQTPTYAGRTALSLEVPRAGTYVLTCTADQPFVIAIGPAVGFSFLAMFGAIGAFLVGGGLITLGLVRRSKR